MGRQSLPTSNCLENMSSNFLIFSPSVSTEVDYRLFKEIQGLKRWKKIQVVFFPLSFLNGDPKNIEYFYFQPSLNYSETFFQLKYEVTKTDIWFFSTHFCGNKNTYKSL